MSQDLLAGIEDWLRRRGAEPERDDEDGLRFGLTVGSEKLEGEVFAFPESGAIACYLYAPGEASESWRTRVAEYLTRANDGLLFGNFEMDFETGIVRFKTTLSVLETGGSDDAFRELVEVNAATVEQYLPGYRAVLEGILRPDEAIQRAEEEMA